MIIILALVLYLRGGTPFSPGRLTAAAPRQTALEGFTSHAAFAGECARCHTPWQGISADRCEACHTTVARQRAQETGLHGRLPDTGRCAQCHTDHKGPDADITLLGLQAFDHDQLTNFSLAHHDTDFDGSAIACDECHQGGRLLRETAICFDCHSAAEPTFTADHARFFGDDCLACHDGRDTMVDFNHDTVFVLAGAHTTLDCQACHRDQTFAGTPGACADCHEEPAIHAGQFGLDCQRCHTEQAWQPALLTEHTFPLDHGDEGQIACATCHRDNYATYTCTNCHEHDPAETREEHLEEGIRDIDDCAACHPTGREDEAERFEDGD